MPETPKPQVTTQERRVLTESLGLDEDGTATVGDLRGDVEADADESFQSVGRAVREDLTGELDAERIEDAIDDLAERMDRLSAVRAAGVPDGETEAAELYRELIQPAWDVYDHLADVGFFESLDANMPAFTEEAIRTTAGQFVASESLMESLSENGFDDHERTVLVSNVVNNKTRLSRWVPTSDIPDGVEFDVEYVPPLHQRSMGGALLWVNALDDHLWQKEILVTEAILDDAFWYTKAILAGLYAMMLGARAVAGGDGLDDAETTAALVGGSALAIVNQEEMMKDVFWINEDDRAPSPAR